MYYSTSHQPVACHVTVTHKLYDIPLYKSLVCHHAILLITKRTYALWLLLLLLLSTPRRLLFVQKSSKAFSSLSLTHLSGHFFARLRVCGSDICCFQLAIKQLFAISHSVWGLRTYIHTYKALRWMHDMISVNLYICSKLQISNH